MDCQGHYLTHLLLPICSKTSFKNDSNLPKMLIVSPGTSQSSVSYISFKNFKHAQIAKFRDSGIWKWHILLGIFYALFQKENILGKLLGLNGMNWRLHWYSLCSNRFHTDWEQRVKGCAKNEAHKRAERGWGGKEGKACRQTGILKTTHFGCHAWVWHLMMSSPVINPPISTVNPLLTPRGGRGLIFFKHFWGGA